MPGTESPAHLTGEMAGDFGASASGVEHGLTDMITIPIATATLLASHCRLRACAPDVVPTRAWAARAACWEAVFRLAQTSLSALNMRAHAPSPPGYDPLNLGANPETLKWYREAELQHARWAMVRFSTPLSRVSSPPPLQLGVAGILGQEIFNPSVFFYEAAAKATLPFDILGLAAVQFLLMHWVEVRRWRDFQKPGSVDKDPIFAGNALPSHLVGYPGGIFDPLNFGKDPAALEVAKLKEIKNGASHARTERHPRPLTRAMQAAWRCSPLPASSCLPR